MTDYLFFDSNRLFKGRKLEKARRLRFETAVFFAKQLVNAGFYYKNTGFMPDSLKPENLFVTEDDFLFINDKLVDYVEFDETRYLAGIKDFFYSLIFGDDIDGRSLKSSLKNYSTNFTGAIDTLNQPGHSLVSFLFIVEEILPTEIEYVDRLAHFRIDDDFFESLHKSSRDSIFFILPYNHISPSLFRVFQFDYFAVPDGASIPFGSYNRFAERFFYLNLPKYNPDKLADVDLMWKKVAPLLEDRKEEIVFFENGGNLDAFSLSLFEKIGQKLKNFKVVIFDEKPFSPVYNRLLAEKKAYLLNPHISGELTLINYIFPEYSFRRFVNRLNLESGNLLIPFLMLVGEKDFPDRENLLKKCGLPDEGIKNLKKGKVDLIGEKKGFFVGKECRFPLEKKPKLDREIKEILKKAEQGNLSYLIEKRELIKRNKGKVDIAEFIEKDGSLSSDIKGFFWYCADNFKKALTFWDDSTDKAFYPFLVESLYFLNKFDTLVHFCEEKRFFPSYYYLVLVLGGVELQQVKIDGYCALELAYRKRDFETLKKLLEQRKNRDAVYCRYKAIYSYFHENTDDYKRYFEEAIEVAQEENNFLELALIYKHFGNVMYYTEDFFSARDYYLKAIKVAVDIENEGVFEDIEYNLAHIDTVMCELDRSYKYFYRLYLKEKDTNHYIDQIHLLKSMAKINAFASRTKEAEEYLLKALEIAEKRKLETELPQIHFVLVTIYQDMGDFEKSEYYLNLFEKESDIELFKREIIYKRIELHYYKGDFNKARDYFAKWELKGHDKLQPFLYKWFEIVLFKAKLAKVYDFYKEVEKCPLRHTVFLIKSELIKVYPQLIFVLEEEVIERDYNVVRHFNGEFASIYRQAIVRKKKTKFDPGLFVLFNEILEHSVKGEVFTLKKLLEDLAKWLGLNVLDVMPYQDGLEDEWKFVLADGKKQVCLVSDTEVDNDFYPLFKFLLELISAHVKFVYREKDSMQFDFTCDFLNEIIGRSEAIKSLKENILKVADFNVPVLITGESGTGKELVARALHYCSRRKRNRFVPINCAAIPHNLLESELFGYEKGAFSGAQNSKKGLLEIAGDGTIFLDEIGEMSPMLQAKLLRVLQEREFTPLGSTRIKKVNARFVFATNRDLKKLVKEGRFREDLFFRINAYNIKTPSLNERKEDIPLLATYFLNTHEMGNGKSFAHNVLQILKNYQYKGNVRELQNIITGALILSGDSPVIEVEHLPEYLRPVEVEKKGKLKEAEEEFRRKFIKSAIARCNGNLTKAAKELGITRQRLHQLLRKLGIEND